MRGFTEGRIVHYVMPDGEHRPAIIVKAWDKEQSGHDACANLVVFLDGTNDREVANVSDDPQLTEWQTCKACSESMEPGTWHWPEPA